MTLAKLKLAMFITFILLFGTVLGLTGLLVWYIAPSLYQMSFITLISLLIGLTIFFTFIQWLLAPYIIRFFTNMREIKKDEYPWLHKMLDELTKKAKLPKKPRLYLVYDSTPNAFAFGWSKSRAFIAIHSGLIEMLNKDEIKAVLAHEVGHIKHNDVVLMTLASMIPTIIYYLIIAFGSILTSRTREEERGGIYPLLVFLGAYVAQFFTYLLVLYLSRVREFFSDAFSAVATSPKHMRTALAKISYGFPIISGTKLRQYQTRRAFYITDPIAAVKVSQGVKKDEFEKEMEESIKKKEMERRKLDLGKELMKAMEWERTNPAAWLIEKFSTHPLCYKRLDALYELEDEMKKRTITLDEV